MTFWATVCYCPHCLEKFRAETGQEAPTVLDWDDPLWRQWQKSREAWLLDFAKTVSARVKQHNPAYSVSHNHSSVLHSWHLATPLELTEACDYESGDFYGEPAIHSLACKVYRSLSKSPAFELATSRTRTFTDHVTVKSAEEMRLEAFVASLHSAALLLVDYVNVDGTLNPAVYDFLAPLNAERAGYEPFLGGTMLADVALYLDKNSLYDPSLNGTDIRRMTEAQCNNVSSPHRDAFLGAAKMLQRAHVPYGVVTNATLDQLPRFRTLILPNVMELTAKQAEMIRKFVREGGTLYASGTTSLDRQEKRFLLDDVLGLKYVGPLGYPAINYLTPGSADLKKTLWPQDHVSHAGEKMLQVESLVGVEVLARITLPFVDPALGKAIGQRFAAFHSNPPALQATGHPGITRHRYGKGEVMWVAAPIEKLTEQTNHRLFNWLLGSLRNYPPVFELEAHHSLEMTVHDQPEKGRLIAALLNLAPTPAVPVGGVARLRAPVGKQIRSVRLAPSLHPVAFQLQHGMAQFDVAPVECFRMYVADYE
jgi:hypothetical protein